MTIGRPFIVEKEFTVAELIDAIEKNGYTQAFDGSFIVYDVVGQVAVACAMGQAALNLNAAYPHELNGTFASIRVEDAHFSLRGTIIELNDHEGKSCKQIAKEVRKGFKSVLKNVVTISVIEYREVSNDA